MSNGVLEYINLKIYYSQLLSLYQRLKLSNQISLIEAGALQVALDIIGDKLKEKEQELKVVQ
jgi:hypothetical protein